MKKTFFSVMILCSVSATHAQFSDALSKAKTVAGATGFNSSGLNSGIMSKLGPALSLTPTQKPKVSSAVASYLAAKSKILPLQASAPAAYAQKQSGLFGGLKTKLAGILLKNQMNKFMGLKPATNSPTNVLSQLFF